MAKQDLILIGSGGCMREILWQIEVLNHEKYKWNVLGYVDKQPFLHQGSTDVYVGDLCCSYLGNDDFLLSKQEDTNVVVTVGEPTLRKKIVNKLQSNSRIKFPNLILSNVRISSDIKMGQGCVVSMDCIISTNVSIGDFAFLNMGVTVCHDGKIGKFTTLSPEVKAAGQVELGNLCEIGMGTKIIQGIKIGNYVVAGAGSVVVKDVEDRCKIAGVPAKPLITKRLRE